MLRRDGEALHPPPLTRNHARGNFDFAPVPPSRPRSAHHLEALEVRRQLPASRSPSGGNATGSPSTGTAPNLQENVTSSSAQRGRWFQQGSRGSACLTCVSSLSSKKKRAGVDERASCTCTVGRIHQT